MNVEANRVQYYAALNLAIVHITGARIKAQSIGEKDLQLACENELRRLEKKRAELEEQFENRTGGS